MPKNGQAVVNQAESAKPPVHREEIWGNVVTPSADIIETPEAYLLTLEMPRATKETISVTLEQGRLEVKGSVAPIQREGATVLFSEIRTAGYSRTFTLGDGIDRTKIDASFENGVLTMTLRKGEGLKQREIKIQ